jgi:HEAT repeat protein
MTRTVSLLLASITLLSLGAACAQTADTEALVADLASDNADVRLSSARELAKLGPEPLARLMDLVAGDDQRVAAGARVAVEALVQNLTAPDAPEGREVVVGTLMAVASGDGPVAAKRFALRQLALIGGDGAVPGLSRLMADPEVGEMAQYALARIPGDDALAALIEAAGKADPSIRAGAINALGLRGDPAAVPALKAALDDADANLRMAAVQALGQIPSAEGIPLIWSATTQGSGAERQAARTAYTQLAETLLEAGQETEAEGMYQRIYAEFPALHERCAGLAGLATAAGGDALPTLLEAIGAGPPELRGVAKHALAEMDDAGVTGAVTRAAREGTPEARVALIWVLGMSGDKAAVPGLVAVLRESEEDVKIAALAALGRLQDPLTAKPIVTALSDEAEAVRRAAEAALARIPGDEAAATIVKSLGAASPEVRAILVRTLGLHPARAVDPTLIAMLADPNEGVRIAAIEALGRHQTPDAVPGLIAACLSDSENEAKAASAALTGMTKRRATQAMLDTLATSEAPKRAAILKALGARADADLYDTFLKATEDEDEQVAIAALDGLGRLRDEMAAPVAREIARTGTTEEKAAAIRAYLEIGRAKAQDEPEVALGMYHEALDLAEGDGEKRIALERLAEIGSPESLPRVRPLVQQGSDEVRKAAAGALVAIGEALARSGQTAEAEDVLTSSIDLLDDRNLVRRAAQVMRAIGKPLDLAAKDGFLTEYWVLGPFDDREKLRKADALPTDAAVNLAEPVAFEEQTREWRYRPSDDPLGHLDFEQAVARRDNVGAYAYVEFEVAEAQDVLLKVGSDDDVVCWLNGEKVDEFLDNRGWSPDQDTVKARLRAGTNRLLCKVLNGGGQWALSARLTDREGAPLEVKQWHLTPADIVAKRGFITSFWLLGPLPGREAARTTAVLDPAGEIDLTRTVRYGDRDLGWRWATLESANGVLDLQKAVARQDDAGCYAYAEVLSEQEQDVLLKIGSDDDVYCWLNGSLVHENPVSRPCTVDSDVVEAHLAAGANRLLVKVLQGGGQWALSLRITDPEGNPLALEQRKP